MRIYHDKYPITPYLIDGVTYYFSCDLSDVLCQNKEDHECTDDCSCTIDEIK